MKDDKLYLTHIHESIAKIEKYTSDGMSAFFDDEQTQDAVIRNLQTLAESVKQLSESTKAAQPQIPWKSLIGFRNIIVHNYMGVDILKESGQSSKMIYQHFMK